MAQVQIPELWIPGAEVDTPGMSVVGPLHGPKNRLTPSAAPCPSAAWALQGYSGPSQVALLPPSIPGLASRLLPSPAHCRHTAAHKPALISRARLGP